MSAFRRREIVSLLFFTYAITCTFFGRTASTTNIQLLLSHKKKNTPQRYENEMLNELYTTLVRMYIMFMYMLTCERDGARVT